MDLLLNPTSENSARTARALSSLELGGFEAGSFARPGLQVPIKQHFYAEFLTPRADEPNYAEVRASAQAARLFGYPVFVASPAALIRMKQRAASGSEASAVKHQADIALLRTHVV